jgi:hypothetical protein
MVKTKEKEHIIESVEAFNRAKQTLTETNMVTMQRVIVSYIAEHGRVPESLNDLQLRVPITTGKFDGWGREIIYEKLDDLRFRLTSAGHDGTFDTEDDIVAEY